jgi:hypothetical protein
MELPSDYMASCFRRHWSSECHGTSIRLYGITFQKALVLKVPQVFMAMKVTVFWDVTWFSLIARYLHSGKYAVVIFRKDEDGANRLIQNACPNYETI